MALMRLILAPSVALAAVLIGPCAALSQTDSPNQLLSDNASAPPFRFSAEAIRAAKKTAAFELIQRGDLKSRRPAGLEDIDAPAGLARAIDQAIRDLANADRTSDAMLRLRYLGAAAYVPLVKALLTGDEWTRFRCAILLDRHGARAVGPLEKALFTDDSANVRSVAAQALGKSFDRAAVPRLVRALEDPDHSVRLSAVHALRLFRDSATIEPLSRVDLGIGAQHAVEQALNDIRSPLTEGPGFVPPELYEVFQLAREAETLAGETYGQAEIDRLLEHIDSEYWSISIQCVLAIQSLDARPAVPALIAAKPATWKDGCLAKLATPEAIDYLIGLLQSDDQARRKAAITGLHEAGRWAVPLLVELLDDPSLASDPPINPPQFNDPQFDISQFDDWPQHHAAQSALFINLHNAGLKGRSINLATGQRPEELSVEIEGIKAWWAEHGRDFLEGKPVPVAPITNCYSAS